MLGALEDLLKDPTFQTGAQVACESRQAAEILSKWCALFENHIKLKEFAEKFKQNLESCFKDTVKSSGTTIICRDKLWKNFFLLRSSNGFIQHWTYFLNKILPSPTPALYQHLTAVMFKLLIQQHYKIVDQEVDDSHDLTHHEGMALRYAAGYICRYLRKKLERGRHVLKEELIFCLMSLTKGGEFNEADGTDEQWLNAIDRGGLWHVRENTYGLFCALEVAVQTQLKIISRIRVPSSKKSAVINEVMQSDNVLFYWIICQADFEVDNDDVCETLLKMITELYVTIRGFAYANIWMEKYKQAKRKTTQRSKGLRKDLYSDCATT